VRHDYVYLDEAIMQGKLAAALGALAEFSTVELEEFKI
jgi:hypothetical protein